MKDHGHPELLGVFMVGVVQLGGVVEADPVDRLLSRRQEQAVNALEEILKKVEV